jgi:hypothetical protein
VPVSSSVTPWTLTMPAGSLQQWAFTFTTISAAGQQIPYPIPGGTSATWEYVARVSATDTGAPLISVTTTPTTAGLIAVTATSSLSQVQLDIYPAGTATLAPAQYYHSLWMSPATTGAFCWFTGDLVIQGTPQP